MVTFSPHIHRNGSAHAIRKTVPAALTAASQFILAFSQTEFVCQIHAGMIYQTNSVWLSCYIHKEKIGKDVDKSKK